MIARRTLSVSLTPELHDFINELVKEGSYGNSSEVVRAGLRLLRDEELQKRQKNVPSASAAEPAKRMVKA